MENIASIFTPEVMIFITLSGCVSNGLTVGFIAFLVWLFKPSVINFLEGFNKAIQDSIQLLQDFKDSIDKLKECVHEMSISISNLNGRMKQVEDHIKESSKEILRR